MFDVEKLSIHVWDAVGSNQDNILIEEFKAICLPWYRTIILSNIACPYHLIALNIDCWQVQHCRCEPIYLLLYERTSITFHNKIAIASHSLNYNHQQKHIPLPLNTLPTLVWTSSLPIERGKLGGSSLLKLCPERWARVYLHARQDSDWVIISVFIYFIDNGAV